MSFKKFGLCKEIIDAIDAKGYKNPTQIQQKSIPNILMGRDLLGCAQTGTGKTGSFLLPIIEILNNGKSKSRMPRSLILAPTRELAIQVSEEFTEINKNLKLQMALIIGGVSFTEQDSKLSKGVDILIATPGRLLDQIERGKIILNDVKILVIDEADRMLDMGFIPDVIKINKLLPKIRQTLFFSATLSNEIRKIGNAFLINPKEIDITPPSTASSNIESFLIKASKKNKLDNLKKVINMEKIKNAVIFCNKKKDINKVSAYLNHHKFTTICLHGDMNQISRIKSLEEFKSGRAQILIASDVAARGIDIAGLSHVFNYDVPLNPEDYVHRIGRTGRAGLKGKAITIIEEDDKRNIIEIESLINKKIEFYNFNKSHNKNSISRDEIGDSTNLKQSNNKFKKYKLPPIENYSNFRDSGMIPDFLTNK